MLLLALATPVARDARVFRLPQRRGGGARGGIAFFATARPEPAPPQARTVAAPLLGSRCRRRGDAARRLRARGGPAERLAIGTLSARTGRRGDARAAAGRLRRAARDRWMRLLADARPVQRSFGMELFTW